MKATSLKPREPLTIAPNLIPHGCREITPSMLTLVELAQNQIERIVDAVPGGAENIQDIYPLAPLQEGMLYHHLLDEEAGAYVLQALLQVDSREHLQAFVSALQHVIGRYDLLRSAVLWEGLPQPVQVVYRHATMRVEEVAPTTGREPLELLRERMMRPPQPKLDPRRAPLIRLQVTPEAQQEHWYVLLQIHHLVCDHQSLQQMFAEVAAYIQRRPWEWEPFQYRNHVAQTLSEARRQDAEVFFSQKLRDVDEPTAPFGVLSGQGSDGQDEQFRQDLDPVLAQRVRIQARRQHVSVATLFHAALALVVSHTSAREDIVYGTVLFGRLQLKGASQRSAGMFLNTLPLRVCLRQITAKELVARTQRDLMDLLSYEQTPLALARRCSGVRESLPLFTTLLNYRYGARSAAEELHNEATGIREIASRVGANHPITLHLDDLGEGFALTFQTLGKLDPRRLLGYMTQAIQSLVEALERAPQKAALSLTVLPESERHQILTQFNATQATYPRERLIHELFEEQVTRTPQAIAVTCEAQSLTYADLDARANQLARVLRVRGVGPDQLVALYLERGLDMVVGLLGILKAGGAYVPLDPSYPLERLQYMLGDVAPKILLTQEALKERLQNTEAQVIALDSDWPQIGLHDPSPLQARTTGLRPDHLAYVIYTSGSTGRPKGVMVPHGGVVNFLYSMQRSLEIQPTDCLLAVTTLSFDIAALEIYLPLVHGARVQIATRAVTRDPRQLITLMEASGATMLQATPATWQLLLGAGWSGRSGLKALCGGEALSTQLAGELLGRVGCLWNLYGPTETTIWSCIQKVSEASDGRTAIEPIGRPIANTGIYVLDPQLRPVPIGVTGEIFIGGAGVVRGYWGRPELTSERFVVDPFAGDPQARMYRTGDLGRWRSDGTLEYLGRNDYQIKIRGFRIELGEIEAQLVRHEQVKEAVVIAREDVVGEKRLVAYVTCKERTDGAVNAELLRTHLKQVLPEHMIPNGFVILTSFPLTPSGKLDRRALPAPDVEAYAHPLYEPPRGAVEEVLAGIWQDVLRVKRVGRRDNFFELGGHSLHGMTLMIKAADALEVQLPIAAIFQYPTIGQMAQYVGGLRSAATEPALRPRPPLQHVPLSFSQQWLWNTLGMGRHGNMAGVLVQGVRLIGELDVSVLRESLTKLVQRHEALRTSIVTVEGSPRQHIEPPSDCDLDLDSVDLTGLSPSERQTQARYLAEQLGREPFSATNGRLFAVRLLKLADLDHVLVIAMHHIISDGASMGIALRDVFALYAQTAQGIANSPANPPIQFADYAVWQHQVHPHWVEKHDGYWKEHLRGAQRVRSTPAETAIVGRPSGQLTLPVSFGRVLSERLREFSRQEQTTLVMSVLTVYVALVSRWYRQTDLVIPFITLGRHHPEVENVIGFFGAPLFLRVTVREADSFLDLLRRLIQEYGTACEHHDFSRVAAQLPEPEFVWNPIFNWLLPEFNMSPGGELPGSNCGDRITIEPCPFDITPPEALNWNGELRVDLADTADGVQGTLGYSAGSFTTQTMEHFKACFHSFTTQLVTDPATPIAGVPLT